MKTQQRSFAHRVGPLLTALFLATVGSSTAWAQAYLGVPGFGPGVAGHISVGPTTPVCQLNVPCTKPFADARVLVLDGTNRDIVVGKAVTNAQGNFIVSVPHGDYLVHVQVGDFPRCEEVKARVGKRAFPLVHIDCDTGIR